MSVLDRQVREDLRATVDQARRERIEREERREEELREMALTRTARNARAYRERQRLAQAKANLLAAKAMLTADAAKVKADQEAFALIEAIVTAPPAVPLCGHRGLRATRYAAGADRANDLADFRCPDCRMILDGPA